MNLQDDRGPCECSEFIREMLLCACGC